ncbi:3-isopropylmalate dehydratase small subunit [Sphingomonas cavernae]|uniref:3-isopropylmalate dehydratase small subunit n=1 Tax=Sphingomonas cavernae TaxID=2320861 RepID=A0A418WJP3_9SPHN|nr:3-isopropylmalate dehydratase small subunit [Sphingomonas cavernae]RJF90266.1 3-isopropylmalate dehydratase small subunit [Sphingomonas cavernae]
MTPFIRLEAIAAALPIANVDTDMLVPAKYLKTVSRSGLGRALLHGLRFDQQESEIPEFILNRDPWRASHILVTLENFGCGSSREHAPWALLDFGIRCVIAPSFADIFHANCLKNGILPVTLPRSEIDILLADSSHQNTACLIVDLVTQTILRVNGECISFKMDAASRDRLLNGLDDIDRSLGYKALIDEHEVAAMAAMPWRPFVSRARLDSLG